MSGAEVWVRPGGTDEVADIVELSGALFRQNAGQRDPFVSLGWPEEEGLGYFAALVGGDEAICLLAEFAGRMVGYLAGRVGEGTTMGR